MYIWYFMLKWLDGLKFGMKIAFILYKIAYMLYGKYYICCCITRVTLMIGSPAQICYF